MAAIALRDETRRELSNRLSALLTILMGAFPAYDFLETSLAQRVFSCEEITASAPSEKANSGES